MLFSNMIRLTSRFGILETRDRERYKIILGTREMKLVRLEEFEAHALAMASLAV